MEIAEHTLFVCARWGVAREAVGRAVGAELTPDTMVSLMLQSEQKRIQQKYKNNINYFFRNLDNNDNNVNDNNKLLNPGLYKNVNSGQFQNRNQPYENRYRQ